MVEFWRLKSFGLFQMIYADGGSFTRSENNFLKATTKLMAFLNEEVEGAIITRKIRGDVTGLDPLTPTTAAFHVRTKSTKPPTSKPKGRQKPFCVFCENRGHWAQDCKEFTDVKDRTEKLKLASRCFLCLNRGHSLKNCSKKGKFLL